MTDETLQTIELTPEALASVTGGACIRVDHASAHHHRRRIRRSRQLRRGHRYELRGHVVHDYFSGGGGW